jgi:hypothetical protein
MFFFGGNPCRFLAQRRYPCRFFHLTLSQRLFFQPVIFIISR